MTTPRVSVVIPNYNHERYLPDRLGSVLRQTVSDIEVIFLDDASTDRSVEVFRKVAGADPRVRAILNPRNSGSTFAQWNRGVAAAGGEFVWVAESDDVAHPRLLETLLERLTRHPSAVLAYCRSSEIDSEGRAIGRSHPLGEAWDADFLHAGADEIARSLVHSNTIPNASAVVFRRDAYLSAGGADESLRFTGDWLCWIGLCFQGDVAYVAEPLNRWRWHARTVRAREDRSAAGLKEWLCGPRHAFRTGVIPWRTREAVRDAVFEKCFVPGALRKFSRRERRALRAIAREIDPLLPLRFPMYYGRKVVRGLRARVWGAPRRRGAGEPGPSPQAAWPADARFGS